MGVNRELMRRIRELAAEGSGQFVGRLDRREVAAATPGAILPISRAAPFSSKDLASRGTAPSPAQTDNAVACCSAPCASGLSLRIAAVPSLAPTRQDITEVSLPK
jgi:hypothetical protein